MLACMHLPHQHSRPAHSGSACPSAQLCAHAHTTCMYWMHLACCACLRTTRTDTHVSAARHDGAAEHQCVSSEHEARTQLVARRLRPLQWIAAGDPRGGPDLHGAGVRRHRPGAPAGAPRGRAARGAAPPSWTRTSSACTGSRCCRRAPHAPACSRPRLQRQSCTHCAQACAGIEA